MGGFLCRDVQVSGLYDRALAAVWQLFGDRSVPPEETLSLLEQLRDEIEIIMIEGIENDRLSGKKC